MAEPIFHIAFASDWADAEAVGEYRISTRGASLEEVGFIHCAFRHQVQAVRDMFYADVAEALVVLVIDQTKVRAPIRIENLDGGTERFPHIYGPLPTAAVSEVRSR